MQIADIVSANQTPIRGEGDIALENTSAHACTGIGRLCRLFGDLQSPTTSMTDAESAHGDGLVVAGFQCLLEWAVGHVHNEVVGADPERDKIGLLIVPTRGVDRRCGSEVGRQSHQGRTADGRAHFGLDFEALSPKFW